MKAANRRVTVVAALLAMFLTGCATKGGLGWTAVNPHAQPASTAVSGPPPVSVPVSEVLAAGQGMPIGVYESGFPHSATAVRPFSSATGVQPRMLEYFSSWGERFMTTFADAAHAGGAVPVVQIEPTGVPMASIAAGQFDTYLRQYALAVRAYRYSVILCFGHEMNGYWYSWGNTKTPPAQYIAAWRHLVTVFRSAGATNVKWLWAINNFNPGETSVSSNIVQWWPGQQWVDLVGIDGYYFTAGLTFDSVFGPAIAGIRQLTNAPVMIAETAVGVTTTRETQIAGLFAGAKADNLFGIIWFDAAQGTNLYHQNWNLEADPAAAAAFKAAVASS